MRYIFTLLNVWVFFLISGCANSQSRNKVFCDPEYQTYYNYNNVTILNKVKIIANLKKIDDDSLNFYLKNGVNFYELNQDQIIFVPLNEFFKDINLSGYLPLYVMGYVMGYVQDGATKQYLVAELSLGQNSHLYMINQLNDKIVSAFLVYSNSSTGFNSTYVETQMLSRSLFKINIAQSADRKNNKGSNATKCHYLIQLSDSGRLDSVRDDGTIIK